MCDVLLNVLFIGFIGIFILVEDKDICVVFGDYVFIYDIQDVVEDGVIVLIYYELCLVKLDIRQDDIEKLNVDVDEVFEDEEDIVQKEKVKFKWVVLEKLVGVELRMVEVVEDLVNYFEM